MKGFPVRILVVLLKNAQRKNIPQTRNPKLMQRQPMGNFDPLCLCDKPSGGVKEFAMAENVSWFAEAKSLF
jgi:hypothetical protein